MARLLDQALRLTGRAARVVDEAQLHFAPPVAVPLRGVCEEGAGRIGRHIARHPFGGTDRLAELRPVGCRPRRRPTGRNQPA